MKKCKFLLALVLMALPIVGGAVAGDRVLPTEVAQINDSLKRIYAPDRRVDLFDVDYSIADRHVMLRGVTTSAEAKQALVGALRKKGYEVMDCLRLLPDADNLEGKVWAIVNVSVCNLRAEGDFSSEMMTQALMGMPVRVLERDGWYRVQTPDRYIAWVHRVGIHPVTRKELEAWNRAEKVVVTAHYGFVYSCPDVKSQTVSDVVAGNRFRYEGRKGAFFAVSYPDGRKGYLPRSMAQTETEWRKGLKQDAASIIATAKTLMGVPYLWAGTSSKGVDCSGFMRTTLFLHDIIIPRDASQQAYKGEHIDIASDFSNLQPGDLIFFGRKATPERKERVVHVGMYIGQGRFIHSQGDVRISSFLPNDELFDAYNLGRLLFATRVLPYINKEEGLNTTATNLFYTVLNDK
ncbi:MAG: NlpC/P60 family protein [Bacteroides sp.]